MRYFGTDGIRGRADFIINKNYAEKLGEILALKGGRIAVSRDVRSSSFDIEKQLVRGLLKGGAKIYVTGVLPTPALSYIAGLVDADYAVMITASHNPPEFNGLKIFGKGGKKLSPCEELSIDDALERAFDAEEKARDGISCDASPVEELSAAKILSNADQFRSEAARSSDIELSGELCLPTEEDSLSSDAEAHLRNLLSKESTSAGKTAATSSREIKRNLISREERRLCALYPDSVTVLDGAEFAYKKHIVSMFPRFDGFKIRLDNAHGCYAELAKDVFEELGATVIAENDTRDGELVNVGCGSTHISKFAPSVKREEIGFAFDGDGDRVLAAVDGKIYDGDAILLALSMLYRLRGKLKNRFIVGTVLTNSRLQRELAWQGTALIRADVGDKNVLNALLEKNCLLGGEKSGHIIMLDKADTGDGLITALTLLEAKKTMGSLPKFSPYPMREYNIRAENPAETVMDEDFNEKVIRATETVGLKGRLIVRPSGTEPYIRVAIEYFSKNHSEIFVRVQNIFGL